MRTILSLALLLTWIGFKAQNNLVVFSENGEKFFLIINGIKQNIEAETNVKVTDLIQPNYKVKIVFEEKSKGVVDQNIYFMQGGEPVKNHEFVYSVGIKKKGGYKARPVSAVAIGPQTKVETDQTVVHYTTSEPTPSNNNVINLADDGTSTNTNSNVQTNQVVTQTQTQTGSNGENVNVGVNVNGMGVNINVNDNMGGNVSTTTSQTVTTTKTSGGTTVTKSSTSANTNGNVTKTTTESTSVKNKSYTDGYEVGTKVNNTPACSTGMSATSFNEAKESIDSKGMDDSKLKVAKQVLDNNCMTSAQVKEVVELFSFEQSKLDFAKYAYGRTTDKNNYYKINDTFTFESSITELNNHIKNTNSSK